jgi:endonuclease-8
MEGPSLVILREELQPFLGQKVLKVTGNTKQPKESLKGRKLERIETWGKVLFLTFTQPKKAPVITKTHFLMFGSYRINDPKIGRDPRLELKFKNGIVYFYSCSIQFGADEYLRAVDHQADIMSDEWKIKHVVKLMKERKDSFLCDLFLDQKVFAGSGNIVKNEVLFNIRCHPLTKLSQVPEADWPKVAQAVHRYGEKFYEWKKIFELRRHWQVYRKHSCPVCGAKIIRTKTGKWPRGSFFCPNCQALKARIRNLKVFPVLPVQGKAIPEKRLDH